VSIVEGDEGDKGEVAEDGNHEAVDEYGGPGGVEGGMFPAEESGV